MKFAHLSCLLLCGLVAGGATHAQETAASAPGIRQPPRVKSPSERRDSAELPANIRNEDQAPGQLNIPLGRTPPPPAPSGRGSKKGIDDSVARCEAQTDLQARKDCRARLARAGQARP